jgi:arylsulfatase A-like enzyme
MKNILLISKEVLRPDYLSCYGGKLYKTVNIDKLAKEGTRFTNFYTAAPSSAMAFTAMFTGLYPFETRRKSYREVKKFDQCPTLSELLENQGYKIHVVWGGKWFRGSYKRSRVFSSTTQFHNSEDIYQLVGPHRSEKKREEAHLPVLKKR